MELKEKVAYIKGMMEGMEFDTATKEGKLLAAVVDVLEEMAKEVTNIDEDVDTLYDEVDAMSEDARADSIRASTLGTSLVATPRTTWSSSPRSSRKTPRSLRSLIRSKQRFGKDCVRSRVRGPAIWRELSPTTRT